MMAKKKKRKPKTIGQITNSRGEWLLNPITKIKESKKIYKRIHEKSKIRRGEEI